MNNLLFFIVNAVIAVIIGINIVLFCKYIYRHNVELKNQVWFVILYVIAMCVTRQLLGMTTKQLVIVILRITIYISTILLIYKVLKMSFWRTLLVFCIVLLAMSIGEIITMLAFAAMGLDLTKIAEGNNLLFYFIGNMFINLFQMLILYAIRISKSISSYAGKLKNQTYFYIIINISLTIATVVLTTIILTYAHQDILVIALYICMAVVSLLCNLVTISMLLRVDFKDEKLRMQEQYNEILIELKHKFFGILSIIMALVDKGDLEGLRSYASELDKGIVERIKSMPTNIKNSKLFYIIAVKLTEANDKGISFKLRIPYDIDEIKGIREDDLVYIVNELMSNAIENASKSSEKEVDMKIEALLDRLKLTIENTIDETSKAEGIKVLSKSRKVGRGHGLKQINKMIKDNTYFKISVTDRFKAELVIGYDN